MKILITICARKNSKRLPGKNMKIFHNKPLIQWTLEQAYDFKKQVLKQYENVDVVVSTDIHHNFIPKFKGLYIIERPPHLAEDDTNKLDVINDIISYMKFVDRCDYIIDLDVTAPLRKRCDIKNALDLFIKKHTEDGRCYNLFSVVNARRIPWFNQICLLKDGSIKPSSDFNYFYGSEGVDVSDLNASIYIYRPEFFNMKFRSPIQEHSCIYEMEDWQFCDIDTQTDWDIAGFLFQKYILNK